MWVFLASIGNRQSGGVGKTLPMFQESFGLGRWDQNFSRGLFFWMEWSGWTCCQLWSLKDRFCISAINIFVRGIHFVTLTNSLSCLLCHTAIQLLSFLPSVICGSILVSHVCPYSSVCRHKAMFIQGSPCIWELSYLGHVWNQLQN